MKTFGEKLKELRTEKKLTQKELAKTLSITTPTLSHWECDYQEPSIKDLIQICIFFNIESDYLIGLSDNLENLIIKQELLNKKNPLDELPSDQKKLLDIYKQLSYEGKIRVIARAEDLLKDSREKEAQSFFKHKK